VACKHVHFDRFSHHRSLGLGIHLAQRCGAREGKTILNKKKRKDKKKNKKKKTTSYLSGLGVFAFFSLSESIGGIYASLAGQNTRRLKNQSINNQSK
jgi:hypothetical protein